MNNQLKNYGFDPDKVKIKPEDYILGSNLPLKTLKKDKNYEDFLPVYEPQSNDNYDTYGCTVWAGLNQIETYIKLLYSFEPNYSDRFNYILAGIKPPGANPHDAYESFRKDGVINQESTSFPDTLEEFMNPNFITSKLKSEGKEWLKEYDYYHEWVRPKNPEKMKELIINALEYSPIAVAVTAWIEQDGLYIDNGQRNTHFVLCYDHYIKDDKIYLKIFDSYDLSKKVLHPDHTISVAKRIYMRKRIKPIGKITLWSRLVAFIKRYFGIV